MPGFQLSTFRSRARRLTNKLSRLPRVSVILTIKNIEVRSPVIFLRVKAHKTCLPAVIAASDTTQQTISHPCWAIAVVKDLTKIERNLTNVKMATHLKNDTQVLGTNQWGEKVLIACLLLARCIKHAF